MANKRMFIAGAGGFGRELITWAADYCEEQGEGDVVGFLDDNPHALGDFPCDWQVVGNLDDFQFEPDDRVIVAVCEPTLKQRIVERLQGRVKFATVIHPSADVGPHCKIGVGCVVCPHVVLTTNVTLGNHVHLNLAVTVGHDAQIGSFATLNSHVDVTGGAIVEEGVFMGSHASVLPKARVGAFARIGAGSVVLRNVRPHETVLGVPAQKV